MSRAELLAQFAGAAVVAALLTWLSLRHALTHGLLDIPNARSSHTRATPRGGGIAIVVTTLVGSAVVSASGVLPWSVAFTFIGAAAAIATIGYLDDRWGMSRRVRLLVHVLAAAACVITLDAAPAGQALTAGLSGSVVAVALVLGITWHINLFNFMDGIDGLAGSQGLYVAAASATLAWDHGNALAALPILTAGACGGFLVWNRPPAKIFMGDVGSGFLGFWIAALALLLCTYAGVTLWTSLVLNSVFIADATVTLLRRLVRRQRWYDAHRSHAYQNLSRRWGSHGKVTGLLWAANLFVVTPLAMLTTRESQLGPAIAATAVIGFAALAVLAGAGAQERSR